MTDVLYRLRSRWNRDMQDKRFADSLPREAADEIERLLEDNKRLRSLVAKVNRQAAAAYRKLGTEELEGAETEWRNLDAERERLRAERAEAVKMARGVCRDADWVADWPEELHLADVIEKRLYNMAIGWRHEIERLRAENAEMRDWQAEVLSAMDEIRLRAPGTVLGGE